MVPRNMPPQPPTANPRFHPEKSPEIEDAGVAPKLPVLEITYVDVTVGDATFVLLVGHLFPFISRRAAMRTLKGP
jgi:hypothetical protein